MSLDEALFQAINGVAGRSETVDWLMVQLARPRNLYYPGGLAAAYWLWRNWRECLIGSAALAGVIGMADGIGTFCKDLVQRPRPCLTLQNVHALLGCGKAFSFPSNHAVNTAAAAAFFQVLYPRSGWISWPLVAAIGFSRVYIGAHYLSDVMGGWVIGGAIGAGVAYFLSRRVWFRPATVGQAALPPSAPSPDAAS
ncbi:MAG: phosphatase PAP2 family protein [Nitrospiraceae bacterium]|nr:phosphatase PAP2 family protein [Nitrospiraceae bacterium]